MALYRDYLENGEFHVDASVTVEIEGKTIRFEDEEQFAEFLAGVME